MEKAFRKTGIDIIGDASWGTHLCQFYETREDLVDILVPYFKAGLKNNEFCMWITSEPLKVEDAKAALKKVVKNLDNFIKKGQIEILDYREWYTKSGEFDAKNVLQGWVEKENQALKRGYDGLRLSGNTFWLEEKDWRNFTDYEEEINRVIGKYRMIAICTYSLAKCGASEVIDVISNHQFALIRRKGKWVIIESSEQKRAEGALRESEEQYRSLFDNMLDGFAHCRMLFEHNRPQDFIYLDVNNAFEKLTGLKNVVGKKATEVIPGIRESNPELFEIYGRVALTGIPERFEVYLASLRAWLSISVYSTGKEYFVATFDNITERKRTEEALRYQAALLANTHDAIIASDEHYRLTAWNAAAESLYGWKAEEVLGRFGLDIIQTEFPGVDKSEMLRTIAETGHWRGEVTQARKDGTQIPVEIASIVLHDESGRITGYVSVNRDITERKRAEKALRESEEKYRGLTENVNLGIYRNTVGPEGKFIEANPTIIRMFGYKSKEEFLAINVSGLYQNAEDRKKFNDKMLRKGFVKNEELWLKRKDGSLFVASVSAVAVKDEQGHMKYYDGIIDDITERKRAEEALRESEARFRGYFELPLIGVAITSPEKGWIEVNDQICSMMGYSREELLRLTWSELTHPEDLAADVEQFNRILAGQIDSYSMDKRFIRKNGEVVWTSVAVGCVRDSGGRVKHIVALGLDITERKRAEQEIRNLAKFPSENPFPVLRLSQGGMVLYANEASRVLLQDWRSTVGDFAPPFWRDVAAQALANQSRRTVDVTCGQQVYSFVVSPIQEAGYINLYGIDITERKRAEEALRESEEKFRSLASTADSMYLVDRECRYQFMNEGHLLRFGLSLDKVVGRSYGEFHSEKDTRRFAENVERVFETGRSFQTEHKSQRDNKYFLRTFSPVMDSEGNTFAVTVVSKDITERKRAELEYKAIVGTAMDGFWIIDAQGRFLDMNDAYCRLIGYSREELLKMKISDIEAKEKPKETVRRIRKIMEVGGDRFETRHRCKDGRVIDIEVSVNYNKESGDKLFVFLRDVTQRKQMGEALAKYIGELQQLSKQLITVQEAERLRISQELHDEMGQALTMLRINIASIKESLPPGYAKGIKDRLADADALTEKILGQIHELTLELRPHMLDDLGLVSTVRWYTERMSRRLNIQILFTQKNLKRRLAPEIRTTLFRIIQEALTNAAKHARAKKVRILLAQKQKFIELIIQDDGCGFDQRKIEKRPSRARGIGLFSMKERAALLNGECAIESRPGAGTKVRIRIPWRKAVEKN